MSSHKFEFVRINIWDIFIRIFHWLLAALVLVMFVSANFGNFDIHILAGKGIAVLLVARIFWGLLGSSNARFSVLLFKPREYFNYIRTLPQRKPGYSVAHSPIGALAVIAILLVLLVQVCTGLVASDIDGIYEGPFAYYVDYDFSRWATEIHYANKRFVIALVVLHISANLFYYFYKKDNLIKPMITGNRRVPKDVAEAAPQLSSKIRATVISMIAAALMIGLFVQFG